MQYPRWWDRQSFEKLELECFEEYFKDTIFAEGSDGCWSWLVAWSTPRVATIIFIYDDKDKDYRNINDNDNNEDNDNEMMWLIKVF